MPQIPAMCFVGIPEVKYNGAKYDTSSTSSIISNTSSFYNYPQKIVIPDPKTISLKKLKFKCDRYDNHIFTNVKSNYYATYTNCNIFSKKNTEYEVKQFEETYKDDLEILKSIYKEFEICFCLTFS